MKKFNFKFLIDQIIGDQNIRLKIIRESHEFFFNVYLPHYVTYKPAPFHRLMFKLTEDEQSKMIILVAFRGCGKSTLITLSYPLWAMLGQQQKKFVVIIGQTQRQVRLHLSNIKRELETNLLLRHDLGPFEENEDWGAYSLVLPKYGARISAVSMEQSIRGMRHGNFRPDLVICDDIEDLNSVRNSDIRENVFNWITGDVIPAGDRNTKYLFIGNMLHSNSLLMRLKNKIATNELDGKYYEIPLIDQNDQITWPGKYPDMSFVEAERKKIGNDNAYLREFLLIDIPPDDIVISKDWIKYYKEFPKDKEYHAIFSGVDLAISQKETAHYSAIVSARLYGYGKESEIYILPNPYNAKKDPSEVMNQIRDLHYAYGSSRHNKFFVESVGYQKLVQMQLHNEGFPAEEYLVHGQDKYSRLAAISYAVKEGRVRFPEQGCETLINQITRFGYEKYDDLADAFAIVIHESLRECFKKRVKIGFKPVDNRPYRLEPACGSGFITNRFKKVYY